MSEQTTGTRCEISDLYFWLGAEAEIVGFTPWQTAWLAPIVSLPPLGESLPIRAGDLGWIATGRRGAFARG